MDNRLRSGLCGVALAALLAGCPDGGSVVWRTVAFETVAGGEAVRHLTLHEGRDVHGHTIGLRYEPAAEGAAPVYLVIDRTDEGAVSGYTVDAGEDSSVERSAAYRVETVPGLRFTTVVTDRDADGTPECSEVFWREETGNLVRHERYLDADLTPDASFSYDYEAGQLVGVGHDQEEDGVTDHVVTFEYDARGRLVRVHHDQGNDGVVESTVTSSYDIWGNLAEQDHAHPGAPQDDHRVRFDWSCTTGAAPSPHFRQEDIGVAQGLSLVRWEGTETAAPFMKTIVITEVLPSGAALLHLAGRITIGDGDVQLRNAVIEAVNSGHVNLILDFGDVTTMDSSGIGELVSAYTTAANQGGRVVLARVPSKIQDILQITQLVTIFDVYDTVDQAVAAMG